MVKFIVSLTIAMLGSSFSTTADAQEILLVLGDSISAGYGIEKKLAYPQLLENKLKEEDHSIKVINGAESGSHSSSLLPRLKFYTKRTKPKWVILAIGGNDARVNRPVKNIENNIEKAIDFALENKIKVLLFEQKVFSNYDPEYRKDFEELYTRLAKSKKVQLIPFFLEGVGGEKSMNQTDGFHPNPKGHIKILSNIYPHILKAL